MRTFLFFLTPRSISSHEANFLLLYFYICTGIAVHFKPGDIFGRRMGRDVGKRAFKRFQKLTRNIRGFKGDQKSRKLDENIYVAKGITKLKFIKKIGEKARVLFLEERERRFSTPRKK